VKPIVHSIAVVGALAILAASVVARADETQPESPAVVTAIDATALAALAPTAGARPAEPGYVDRAKELVMHGLGLLGIRYKFGGNNPEQGFDCSGFVRYIYNQVAGLVLPRSSHDMVKVGQSVAPNELQPGDLVFYNTRRAPNSHVGIYIGDQRFVHAPSTGGVVEIADMKGSYWVKRFNGARRVRF
jgi:cell wall-associated NlpC family hydrolase